MLMMGDRYAQTLDKGLLLYIKSGDFLGVTATRDDIRCLLIARNELAWFLRPERCEIFNSLKTFVFKACYTALYFLRWPAVLLCVTAAITSKRACCCTKRLSMARQKQAVLA